VERNQVSVGDKMAMACLSCGSEKQTDFSAEMIIHFPGREGIDKSVIPVFPKLSVCFDCGSTLFKIAQAELLLLDKGYAA
jgi:hypothetical protein